MLTAMSRSALVLSDNRAENLFVAGQCDQKCFCTL